MTIFDYQDHMEMIETELMESVLNYIRDCDFERYSEEDVMAVLEKNSVTIEDFQILLSPAASSQLERMAQRAMAETKKYFGNGISLFTPLYFSNYCENQCLYCGFNCRNKIVRAKLTDDEIEKELKSIATTGLKEILLLTGESRKHSGLLYIGKAVELASRYFSTVGIEIYPLNTDEYAYLKDCGADFVSVYQETYHLEKYDLVHPAGAKRVFPYRFNAQERALRGGMRGVAFGALLGLDDFRRDALATGMHAYLIQKKYPHAEISFSTPRIRPFINESKKDPHAVGEKELLQVMLAYRLLMPFAGMTISTRERAHFRDHVIGMVATKISAGVSVGVGGHESSEKGDEQFEISDPRTVKEVREMIIGKGLQPVFLDYIRV
jgi:2-iminoacetate synthase